MKCKVNSFRVLITGSHDADFTISGIILLISAFCLLNCSEQTGQNKNSTISFDKQIDKKGYGWTKLLDSAAWKKSYHFQMLSIKDTLWTFHYDGNWYSTDGKNWTKSALPNSIGNLAFLDYVQFNNAVYGIGHFEGNIKNFTLKSEIYKTTDFKQWEVVSKASNLPKRFFIIHLFLITRFG